VDTHRVPEEDRTEPLACRTPSFFRPPSPASFAGFRRGSVRHPPERSCSLQKGQLLPTYRPCHFPPCSKSGGNRTPPSSRALRPSDLAVAGRHGLVVKAARLHHEAFPMAEKIEAGSYPSWPVLSRAETAGAQAPRPSPCKNYTACLQSGPLCVSRNKEA